MPRTRVQPAAPVPSIWDITPMLLDERKKPPLDEGTYISEIKYDGFRVLAQFGDGGCILKTRNGTPCSAWFPEICESLQGVAQMALVDGEICILDDIGRTDFDALQARARRRGWKSGDRAVTYCVFDLLIHDGRAIMDQTLLQRKTLLETLLIEPPAHILYAKHVDASMVSNPISWLYAHALELKLEGVVGKLAESAYLPGERTPAWFKLKRPGAVPPQRFHRGGA